MERKWAAAAALLLALLAGGAARAEASKGSMQIGLSTHYLWPQADAGRLDPAADYGVVFHYWLNSTTSIMGNVEMLSFHAPFDVGLKDKGLTFSSTALMAGVRYNPKVDLWISPFAELGVGYQSWQTKPGDNDIAGRSGGSVLYFAGGGLSYDFRHSFTLSLDARYLYFAMNEELEDTAVLKHGNKYHVAMDPFVNVGFATAGLELSWKFK